MDIQIRPAAAADYDAVNRVFVSELAHHVALLPDRFQMAEPVMRRQWIHDVLAAPEKILLLALVDGAVVGLVLLIDSVSLDDVIYRPRRYLEVDELAILPEYRSRGIGRRLMEEAERFAAARGIPTVELHVWEVNEQARAFYDRLGYRTIRRRLARTIS
ncbi:MAG: GNAT family N-acetyltransferase [Chloroflexota bacterium]|jgi:ribosomal protein S18 acetylase RimI-like enzyme